MKEIKGIGKGFLTYAAEALRGLRGGASVSYDLVEVGVKHSRIGLRRLFTYRKYGRYPDEATYRREVLGLPG